MISQRPRTSPGNAQPRVHRWEKVAVFIFGTVFLIVILLIAIIIPYPSEFQIYVFRVVLALAAAGIGAAIPGFIIVNVSKRVRAGGALALFVIVYLINPPALVIKGAEHEGYLGNLHKHLNALPSREFSLILIDKELNDFWIDGIYSGKTWGDVLNKICEDRSHHCLECDPPPGKIRNTVSIRVIGGPKNLVNISKDSRARYVCPTQGTNQ